MPSAAVPPWAVEAAEGPGPAAVRDLEEAPVLVEARDRGVVRDRAAAHVLEVAPWHDQAEERGRVEALDQEALDQEALDQEAQAAAWHARICRAIGHRLAMSAVVRGLACPLLPGREMRMPVGLLWEGSAEQATLGLVRERRVRRERSRPESPGRERLTVREAETDLRWAISIVPRNCPGSGPIDREAVIGQGAVLVLRGQAAVVAGSRVAAIGQALIIDQASAIGPASIIVQASATGPASIIDLGSITGRALPIDPAAAEAVSSGAPATTGLVNGRTGQRSEVAATVHSGLAAITS